MQCRGVRAATTVSSNDREHILSAAEELLSQTVQANGIKLEDVACVFFTTTRDLNAAFPASVAREMTGWQTVPLMCSHEMDVPGSLGMCLRIMLLWNTDKKAEEVVHVYTRGASDLRTRGAVVQTSDD